MLTSYCNIYVKDTLPEERHRTQPAF